MLLELGWQYLTREVDPEPTMLDYAFRAYEECSELVPLINETLPLKEEE